ncbi:MAG: ABC transporter transmembrane domain-containing protein, partial [candidate division KSB1 bacterium]|nr:ABC transporter transmembrane domain-containing protein [candidate division KSB1 bacterium]
MSLLKPLLRLKKYLRQYRSELAISGILIIISNGLYAIIPKILQRTIDAIGGQLSLTRLAGHVGILLAATTLYAVIRFFIRKAMIGVSRKIEYQLRNDYFGHLQRLSQQFFIKYKTGDLMARATNDIGAVTMTIGMGAMFAITNTLVFIFVVAMMLSTNAKLAVLALIPFPLILFVMYVSFGFFYKIYEQVQGIYSGITSHVQETIAGIRVVQAYVQEPNEIRQFAQVNQRYLKENLALARARGIMWSLMMLLFGLSLVILLWFGGNAVMANRISLGDLVAFTAWVGMLSWPMISLGWVLNLIQRASASMNRINEIMDTEPLIADGVNTDYQIKTLRGEIEFRNVSFAYNGKP